MGASLATIELNRQRELYLCDRDLTQPGIRIFDTVADTAIAFRDVGIPPFDIAFIQAPMAGTNPETQPDHESGMLTAWTYPNPFRQATNIMFTVPREASGTGVRISIYDPLGRRCRWDLFLQTLSRRSQAGSSAHCYTVASVPSVPAVPGIDITSVLTLCGFARRLFFAGPVGTAG
jgi:hypothetical protein